MKNFLFVSDLDHTIIYSRYSRHPECCCVEEKEGVPITYMTAKAISYLHKLIKMDNFSFIPCTLRSWEQTSRISFINSENTPTVVCDNGFSIYHDGKLDADWDDFIRSEISLAENSQLKVNFDRKVEVDHIPVNQVKSNRDAFFTIIFPDIDTSNKYIDKLLPLVDTLKYDIERQGRKTYIIPQRLNKAVAVSALKQKYHTNILITAGDSSVDIGFVALGDYQFLPALANITVASAIRTKSEGIQSGEEILSNILSMVDREYDGYQLETDGVTR